MRPSKKEIENLSREQIADKFGVCLRTAVRWQKHYNLFRPKIDRLNQTEADKIRVYHEAGRSVHECASTFGCSLTTVYRILNNQIHVDAKDTANISVSYNPKDN